MIARKVFISAVALAVVLIAHPAAARLYTMSIPPSAFNPYLNTTSFQRTATGLSITAGDPGANFFAPLYLPDGAVIRELSVSLYHGSSDKDIAVFLLRNGGTGSTSNMIVALITSSVFGIVTLSGTAGSSWATVDNANYTYCLSLSLPQETTAQVFYKATLTFEATPGAAVIPLY